MSGSELSPRRPPGREVAADLKPAQLPAGLGRAEPSGQDVIDQEPCLGDQVQPGQLGPDPDGVVVGGAVRVPNREHCPLGHGQDLGPHPVSTADGLHGVPQLERPLGAVQQQEPGQAAEQSVDVGVQAAISPRGGHWRHLTIFHLE